MKFSLGYDLKIERISELLLIGGTPPPITPVGKTLKEEDWNLAKKKWKKKIGGVKINLYKFI